MLWDILKKIRAANTTLFPGRSLLCKTHKLDLSFLVSKYCRKVCICLTF